MANVNNLVNAMAKANYGMTKDDAQAQGICIKCKEPLTEANVRSDAEQREVALSGLCGVCFDKIFEEDDD